MLTGQSAILLVISMPCPLNSISPFMITFSRSEKSPPLTWAEEALFRHLIIIRRWPDPPAANPFWSAYMRYLRAQRNTDLSVAEMILLDQSERSA